MSPVASPSAIDDSPTVTIEHTPPATPSPTRQSPILRVRRALQRQSGAGTDEVAWQSRFANVVAGVILGALLLVTLPLWVVLVHMTDPAANNGAGPKVGSLMAVCMMLMGLFLTGAATWMIIVEMRARARIVDALAGLRGRAPARYGPGFDPIPLDPTQFGPAPDENNQPITAPIPAGAGAHDLRQTDLTSTFDPSGQTLASAHSVLRSFGQLHAQIAMLAVALALFLGATVLSF